MKGKILLVEDEKSIRGFLKINLKRSGLEVIETNRRKGKQEKQK